MSVPPAASPSPARRRDDDSGWIGLFRRLPIGLRIFVVVLINLVGLVLVVLFIVRGADGVDQAGQELQRIRRVDHIFGDIAGDISRMQSLAQRALVAPTPAMLQDIETARSTLFERLTDAYPYDADIADELKQAGDLARQVSASYDKARSLNSEIVRLYRDEFLAAAAVVTRGLARLETISSLEGDPSAGVADIKDRFFRAISEANTFYLARDPAAHAAADSALAQIDAAVRALATPTSVEPTRSVTDDTAKGLASVREALTTLKKALDEQAGEVSTSIAANQAQLADGIGRVTHRIQARGVAAQADMEAAVQAMRRRMVIVGLVFLTGSILASLAIATSIGRPLNRLRATMLAIVGGDVGRRVEGTAASDEIGAMARAVEVFQDNTIARMNAEREREAQERRWRDLLESSPIGIFVVAASDGQRLYSNQKFRAMFETRAGAGSGTERPFRDHFAHHQDAVKLSDAVRRFGAVSGSEVRMLRADGVTEWWCLMEVRPVDYAGRPAHIFWAYDVTDRHRAAEDLRAAKDAAEATLSELRDTQASLIEAEKLAAIGGLVAGVAHEVNNPVGISLTVASSLAERTEVFAGEVAGGAVRRSRLDEFVAMVGLAAGQLVGNLGRAAELVRSFKQVAVDRTHSDRRRFDLKETIDQLIASLRPSFKGPVAIATDLADGIEMDSYPGQLGQVVTNLVMNALTHGLAGQTGCIRIATRSNGPDMVVLTVADDGAGMDEETARRVFEPFFTTRRGQGGTGLGLHIVYNIVTLRLGGSITLDTRPGAGATFVVEMPRNAPGDADTA